MISWNRLVLTGCCWVSKSRWCRAALCHHSRIFICTWYWSHWVMEGAVGAEGLQGRQCTAGPGPPADICWQSWGTQAVGGAPRNFPSIVPCMCGCCLPPQNRRPVTILNIIVRMVGSHPGGSPCSIMGYRRQVLPWSAAELRWEKELPHAVSKLGNIHVALYKCSVVVKLGGGGIVTNGLSADTLDLFLILVIRCSGHDDCGP